MLTTINLKLIGFLAKAYVFELYFVFISQGDFILQLQSYLSDMVHFSTDHGPS